MRKFITTILLIVIHSTLYIIQQNDEIQLLKTKLTD